MRLLLRRVVPWVGLPCVFVGACLPSYSFSSSPDGVDASMDTSIDTSADASIDAGPDTFGRTADATTDVVSDGTPQGAAEAGGCPQGRGSTMVRIDAPAASFCIDRYEATNADFNAYLHDPNAVFQAPSMCSSLATSWPTPVDGMDTLPVVSLALCHAWSYCLWAGKRLCSSIGGPDAGRATAGDDLSNEWIYACQNGTHAFEFGYGATYVTGECNVPDPEAGMDGDAAVPPGGFAACHGVLDGGFAQIFDMSGNVSEYDDWASAYDAGSAGTQSRGGSWMFANGQCSQTIGFGVLGGFGDVGFRCCADVAP